MATTFCYKCDEVFEPKRPSQKFCTDNCRKEFYRKEAAKLRSLENIYDICRCCGEEFKPSRLGHEFCSKECYFRHRYELNRVLNTVIEKECRFCGKIFETNINEQIYCSKSCGDSTYRRFNKEKISIQKKNWYEENREQCLAEGKEKRKTFEWKDSHRDWCYKKRYNMTLSEYNILFNNQNGCCAVCGTHQKELKKKLSVDHAHDTGKVRGLLCSNCNTGIGLFQDDVILLKQAIKYLGGDR